MARKDIGIYHTGVSEELAIVHKEYDASGEELGDQSQNGDSVDVIILGFENGKRRNVAIGTDKNQFER